MLHNKLCTCRVKQFIFYSCRNVIVLRLSLANVKITGPINVNFWVIHAPGHMSKLYTATISTHLHRQRYRSPSSIIYTVLIIPFTIIKLSSTITFLLLLLFVTLLFFTSSSSTIYIYTLNYYIFRTYLYNIPIRTYII